MKLFLYPPPDTSTVKVPENIFIYKQIRIILHGSLIGMADNGSNLIRIQVFNYLCNKIMVKNHCYTYATLTVVKVH